MACWICSQRQVAAARPATIGETNAVRVAWCQPRSRMPGKAASHRRCSNSCPSTIPTIRSRPSLPRPLAARDRRRDDVGRVRRVLLPVDVVVVHHADHERVERARRRPGRASCRCRSRLPAPRPAMLVEHRQRDLHVVLQVARRGRSPASRAGTAWPRGPRRARGLEYARSAAQRAMGAVIVSVVSAHGCASSHLARFLNGRKLMKSA